MGTGQQALLMGAASATTPSGIPNIWEWWEPSRQGGLSNNDPFSTLTGQANGRDLTASGSSAPIYNTNILNSLAVATLTPTTNIKYFVFSVAPTSLTATQAFFVLKAASDPASGTHNEGVLHDLSGSGSNSHYPYTDGTIYDGFGSATRSTVGDPTPSLAAWRVYEVVSTGTGPSGNFIARLDGTQIFHSATGNTVGWGGGTKHIGASNYDSLAAGWSGQIAGMYFYSAELSAGNRTLQINYINTRFGLSSS